MQSTATTRLRGYTLSISISPSGFEGFSLVPTRTADLANPPKRREIEAFGDQVCRQYMGYLKAKGILR